MEFTNKYLQLLQNSKSNGLVFCNLIAQPTYLWDFQSNKKQLEIILRNYSLNTIIKPSQINNMNLEQKQRLGLISKSKLFTILTERLLTYKLK
jgi:hypothetical protein